MAILPPSPLQTSGGPSREEAKKHQEILNALHEGNLTVVVGAGITIGAIECSTLKSLTLEQKKEKAEKLRWGSLILEGINYLENECEQHFKESEKQELRFYKDLLGGKSSDGPEISAKSDTSEKSKNSGKAENTAAVPTLLRAAAFLRSKLEDCHRLPDWLGEQFRHLYGNYIGEKDEENAVLDSIKKLHQAGARIITTNYDDFLSRHCKTGTIILHNDNDLRRFFAKTDPLKGILHVHGLWSHPTDTVLDPGDYFRVTSHSVLQQALRSCFNGPEVLLFVGAEGGLNDPNFGQLLDWADIELRNLEKRHYILMRKGDKNEKLSLKEVRYGKEYHELPPFLNSFVIDSRAVTDSRNTSPVIRSPDSLSAESRMLTAAFKGESDETIRLVENGAYVNAKDMYECTALHMAAYRGDKMLARRLIQAGALKDVRDLMDETPEQMAERLNNHEVAEIIRGTTRRPNTHSLGTDIGISDGPVG